MTDHFARLNVPRAPWIDPEVLKERFLALSADTHPDKVTVERQKAEDDFRALNESHQILRNHRSRILHLLELQGVASPAHVQALPPLALDLFSSVADVTRASDALLKEKLVVNSPMLKVQFFEKALPCLDLIQTLQTEIRERLRAVEIDLRSSRADEISNLQKIAAALGFLEKWQQQLQERAATLTF